MMSIWLNSGLTDTVLAQVKYKNVRLLKEGATENSRNRRNILS